MENLSAKEVTINYLRNMKRGYEEGLKQDPSYVERHFLKADIETLEHTIKLVEESEGE